MNKNIGVDIGGTTIKAAIIDSKGKIWEKVVIDTMVESGFEKISDNIISMIEGLLYRSTISLDEIHTIGIGIPGVANSEGTIYYATNLHWVNVPLGKKLKEYFPMQKICIENDATVACLAEQAFGCIQNVNNAIMLTLGTGVGGGIIINGEKYSGNIGIGSELGHMIIGQNNVYACNCGNIGCFETYCSATAIIKYTQTLLKEEKGSSLHTYPYDGITAKMVFDAFKNEDFLAQKVIYRFVKYLAIGIANLNNIFNPEHIVLGGGVAQAFDLYIEELRKQVREKILFKELPCAKIVKAQLGNDAGMIGAAMLQ